MKKTKTIKRIFSALWWLLVVLLVLLLVNVLGAKFRGEVPSILGYSVMQVVSGSMEDTIKTGEYILVKKTEPEKIEVNNIISFYSDERVIYGLPNTHRVVDIIETENGREFVTRGDANISVDSVNAREDRLIGVYVGTLTFLGDFTAFLNGGGMLAIIAILWLATFIMIGYTMYKKLKESSDSTDDETNTNKSN